MSYADAADWLAAIEANDIRKRLDFQADLKFAAGFETRESLDAAFRERQILIDEYNRLMMNDTVKQEQAKADATWRMLRLISGGESDA